MGLETVEIVMEVEAAFGISIEDADWERMRTPRDVIEAVVAKIVVADGTACLTQRAFYLLRKGLLAHLPLKRREVVPSALMSSLVPKSRRAALIPMLGEELQTGALPELIRPRWLVVLLTAVSAGIGIGMVVSLRQISPGWSWSGLFFAGGLAGALAGFLASVATASQQTEFPPAAATVGDLACWIMAHKQDLASPTAGRWSREQVAARVREIVMGHLDNPDLYRENADLIKELGLD